MQLYARTMPHFLSVPVLHNFSNCAIKRVSLSLLIVCTIAGHTAACLGRGSSVTIAASGEPVARRTAAVER